jgi:hypothetical protein
VAGDADGAAFDVRVLVEQADDGAQDRALAAAGLADEAKYLATVDGEGNVAGGERCLAAAAIGDAEVVYLDDVRRIGSRVAQCPTSGRRTSERPSPIRIAAKQT